MSLVRFTLCCTCGLHRPKGQHMKDNDIIREILGKPPCDSADCPDCPGSDVYLYASVYGGFDCCGCKLGTPPALETADEVVAHLDAHRAAGHHVPAWDFRAMVEEELAEQAAEPAPEPRP